MKTLADLVFLNDLAGWVADLHQGTSATTSTAFCSTMRELDGQSLQWRP